MKKKLLFRLYSKTNLYQLFLVCAFPLHLWSIMMALRDYSWVAERTNHWDAISFVSYSLIYTLIETVFVYFVILLLGLFVSTKWSSDQRTGIIGFFFLVVSFWALLGQTYYLFSGWLPSEFLDFLVNSGHPVRWLWGLAFPLVVISFLVPLYGILHHHRWTELANSIFERISTLSIMYLLFDGVAIIVMIFRRILN